MVKFSKTMKNKIINSIIIVIFIFTFGALFLKASDREEVLTCTNLLAQSKDFSNGGFYLTQSEKEMCDYHHVEINAPVYNSKTCVNGVSIDTPRCQHEE